MSHNILKSKLRFFSGSELKLSGWEPEELTNINFAYRMTPLHALLTYVKVVRAELYELNLKQIENTDLLKNPCFIGSRPEGRNNIHSLSTKLHTRLASESWAFYFALSGKTRTSQRQYKPLFLPWHRQG